MIRMSYECPETHELLPSRSTGVWTAIDDRSLVVMHCPRCSKRHAFSRADAILGVEEEVRRSEPRLMLTAR